MKNKYISPELELIRVKLADVLMSSSDTVENDSNYTGGIGDWDPPIFEDDDGFGDGSNGGQWNGW